MPTPSAQLGRAVLSRAPRSEPSIPTSLHARRIHSRAFNTIGGRFGGGGSAAQRRRTQVEDPQVREPSLPPAVAATALGTAGPRGARVEGAAKYATLTRAQAIPPHADKH